MPFTTRPVTEDEFAAWARATEVPFFEEIGEERLARWRRISELPRTLGVFDGPDVVGGSMLFRMRVSVPGGDLPMGGLTAVGVLPTHRRRGILTTLMQRHLEDLREWEEPLSGLYAAEAPIYGRYGYGSAAPAMSWTIDVGATRFRPDVHADTTEVRLVPREEAIRDFPAIYETVRAQRPGMPDRSSALWQNWLGEDPPESRDGMSPKYIARLDDRGYVVYRATTGDWPHGLPRGTLRVVEHMAVDTEAAAALWRYVFDHDLIGTFRMNHRPTDDVLQLLLANPRGLTGYRFDGMWLRPVDVPRALAGRTYATESMVRLRVVDRLLPDNSGTWELDGSPQGAECRATQQPADLELDVADLGAAYLGALRFTSLVRASRAVEATPGAARRADLMFATDPDPWSPQEF